MRSRSARGSATSPSWSTTTPAGSCGLVPVGTARRSRSSWIWSAFALWKNPGNLTERQQLKLARAQQLNQRLYRAYLLSQQLREIYRVPFEQAIALLDAWLNWARRCRLAPFVKLARTVTDRSSTVARNIRPEKGRVCRANV